MTAESYALILANGAYPSKKILVAFARRAGIIVAADGGADVAFRFRIRPDIIIGDLDSISSETLDRFAESGVTVKHLPRQSDTDLEKALLYIKRCGYRKTLVAGATGGMTDHTFGNLSILLRHAADMRLVCVDPNYRIDLVTGSVELPVVKGSRVSLVPAGGPCVVSTSGLRYKLKRNRLAFGEKEGTCNTAVSSSLRIAVHEGWLVLFREFDLCLFDDFLLQEEPLD